MNPIIIFALTAVVGLVVMIICVWWFMFNKPKILIADILEERGDGGLILLASNKPIDVIKKKGEQEKWKIRGTAIPPFEPFAKNNQIPYLAARQDKIWLLRDRDNNFHSMTPSVDPVTRQLILKSNYRNTINWTITDIEERSKIQEKTPGWQQYVVPITLVVCFLMFFVTIFFGFELWKGQLNQAYTSYAQIKDEIANLKQSIDPATLQRAAAIVEQSDQMTNAQNWTQTTVTTPTLT